MECGGDWSLGARPRQNLPISGQQKSTLTGTSEPKIFFRQTLIRCDANTRFELEPIPINGRQSDM